MRLTNKSIDFNVYNVEDLNNVEATDKQICIVSDSERGGTFIYDVSKASVNDGGNIFNGWVRQYEGPMHAKWFGAKGDGIANDTVVINAIIATQPAPIILEFDAGDYIINYQTIETQGKHITFTTNDAATINGEFFSSFTYRDGYNGGVANYNVSSKLTDTVFNAHEAIADLTGTVDSEFYAYHFALSSDGTSNEPVRGVIGTVKATGKSPGAFKAIRVGAHDLSTDGCLSVMAYSGSISPTQNTKNPIIMQLSHQPNQGPVNDTVIGLRFDSSDYDSRWQNGIVFEQPIDFNDAVLQAAMGDNSSESARFLKLKNKEATEQLFYVNKYGDVKTNKLQVGNYEPLLISDNSIFREADNANITLQSGNEGTVYVKNGDNTNLTIRNHEIEIGSFEPLTISSSAISRDTELANISLKSGNAGAIYLSNGDVHSVRVKDNLITVGMYSPIHVSNSKIYRDEDDANITIQSGANAAINLSNGDNGITKIENNSIKIGSVDPLTIDETSLGRTEDGANIDLYTGANGNIYLTQGGIRKLIITPEGNIKMPSLITADPVEEGVLWNDGGTLKVSAG